MYQRAYVFAVGLIGLFMQQANAADHVGVGAMNEPRESARPAVVHQGAGAAKEPAERATPAVVHQGAGAAKEPAERATPAARR